MKSGKKERRSPPERALWHAKNNRMHVYGVRDCDFVLGAGIWRFRRLCMNIGSGQDNSFEAEVETYRIRLRRRFGVRPAQGERHDHGDQGWTGAPITRP